MKTKILSLCILFAVAPVCYAELSSSVRVQVHNSSNYVYPCNAGVAQNPKSISKGVDFVRGSWTASQHNPSATAGQGVAIGGSTTTGSPDTDFSMLSGLLGNGSIPYLGYSQLLPEATQYDYVVGQNLSGSGIDINMSSDTYDSGFYVTFCFKPTLVGRDAAVPMQLSFIHAKATHSAVPGAAYNYATDSRLTTMLEIKCTAANGSIVEHYTPNGITSINNLMTPFAGNMTVDLAPSGGLQIGSGISLISGSALNSGALPDDCRIRFYFLETAGTARPHVLTSSDIQIDLAATVKAL